jgi:hypothetical protein
MKRDMDLMRKILLAIEEEYKPGTGSIWILKIEGYDMETIAEHCQMLHRQGFVDSYEATRGGGKIMHFRVGNLTSPGYDYLELIRDNDIWNKTTREIEKKKLPDTFEAIAKIAGIFVGNVIDQLKG